jgi:hypothetical protein
MEIRDTEDFDGGLHNVCGYIPDVSQQLLVPRSLKREVFYGDDQPLLTLSLSLLDTNRFEVVGVNLQVPKSGSAISTSFLTKLSIPKIVRETTVEAIPYSSYWTTPPTDYSDDYLAQLYWFEYVTWGAPRLAIMNLTGWSRANTNHHLRRIAKIFDLPLTQTKA